jgi:hypothetical protein
MKNRTAYKNQWQKDNCDRINFTTPKGHKAEIEAFAKAHGYTHITPFINDAIDERMERDAKVHDHD